MAQAKTSQKIMRVGLTGGIGSGKSAVARLLTHFDIPVIDADRIAHAVTRTDAGVLAELHREFGPTIFTAHGELLRPVLGEIVFTDDNARRRLNQIVHPKVLEKIDAYISDYTQKGVPIVAVDAALIYEAGVEGKFDCIVVVYATLAQRIARVKARDGMGKEHIAKRIRAQMSLEKKAQKADYVVYNTQSLMSLRHQARTLYAWLRVLYERLSSSPPDPRPAR